MSEELPVLVGRVDEATLDEIVEVVERLVRELAQVTQERDRWRDDATHWVLVADGINHDTRCPSHFLGDTEFAPCLRCQRDDLRARLERLGQERTLLQQALVIAEMLPFCGHRDCEGGQHPARNCTGCEALWENWKKAAAACTPTKSAP
jgi:hypothetical protein